MRRVKPLLRAFATIAFLCPAALSQSDPVTFSVNGGVDPHTEGLRRARGMIVPLGTYSFTRTPFPVPPALGIQAPLRPGDVNDYFLASLPSEAELFQSEPDPPPAAPPSGTNNQILVADELGLVAGTLSSTYRDNVNGVSFGEDFFGVSAVAVAPPAMQTAWTARSGVFVEPLVTGDSGTSFRFGVDPWATGLPLTGLRGQAGPADVGAGTGPWGSPLPAAGDVFATPVLTRPGAPLLGTNNVVFDQGLLGLAGSPPAMSFEDDLDALECVGSNDVASWLSGSILLQPGNLLARVAYPSLGPPASAVNYLSPYGAPVFFTVDRNSRGKAMSAVRTQALWMGTPQAAGDVYMAFPEVACFGAGCTTNYLLIDEKEAGLYNGIGSSPTDDMDALILNIHPLDRYMMIELVKYHMPYGYHGQVVTTVDPNPAIAGDEYRTGPGFTYSLVKFFWEEFDYVPRIQLGFSVTTDSIGAATSAVDFETGLKGNMQQAGDIFYTHFGDWPGLGIVNLEPFADGQHYLWYQETELGLDAGTWVPGTVPPQSLADLPDELNALDSTPSYDSPNDSCAFAIAVVEGVVTPGSNTGSTTGPDPVGACGFMASDVWYTFTASCTSLYRATTCVVGTNYDSVVAVWSGACGGLAPVSCNDDSCVLPGQFLSSTTTFMATAGTTYYVSVGGYLGATGSFSLLVNPSAAPTLAFATPGPGGFSYTVSGGPPLGQAFTAMTTYAGAYPAGWLFGVDISLGELVSEFTTGFPFMLPLGVCGDATFGPVFGLPSGLPVYGVSLFYPAGASPATTGPTSHSNATTATIP
jgi:hypothetical protein